MSRKRKSPSQTTPPASGAMPGPPSGAETPHRRLGRPRLIETPEELERRAYEYAAQCEADKKPLTMTGLALSLGFSSRQSLDDYAARPEFSDAAKRARSLVEQSYEARLDRQACAGSIFFLKNHGWADRQDVEWRGIGATFDMAQLDDDELLQVATGTSLIEVLARRVKAAGLLPAGTPQAGGRAIDATEVGPALEAKALPARPTKREPDDTAEA